MMSLFLLLSLFPFLFREGHGTVTDVGDLGFAYVYACRKLWVLDAAVD